MKLSSKIAYFMAVLVPYLALIGYTIAVYPDMPDKLANDLPKAMIFIPAVIAFMLPATYAAMVFLAGKYLRRGHYLTIAAFMDLGILGLMGAVYLIKNS
ncbi:MAG: hypothetical protein FJZ95_03975 [Chloroflexi bacterium]|nr:hypothetical protein [Chloroflexota bacterium]